MCGKLYHVEKAGLLLMLFFSQVRLSMGSNVRPACFAGLNLSDVTPHQRYRGA
jgi:hypothetical protein